MKKTLLTILAFSGVLLSGAPVQWSSGFEEMEVDQLPSGWNFCWGKPVSGDRIAVIGNDALSGKKSLLFARNGAKEMFAYGFQFPEVAEGWMELSLPMKNSADSKNRFHFELFTKSVTNNSRICSYELVGDRLQILQRGKMLAEFMKLPLNRWIRIVSVLPTVCGKQEIAYFRVDVRNLKNESWILGDWKIAPLAPAPVEGYTHLRYIAYANAQGSVLLDDIAVRSLSGKEYPAKMSDASEFRYQRNPVVWKLDFEGQIPGEAPKNWWKAWGADVEKDRIAISNVKSLSASNSLLFHRTGVSKQMYGFATRFPDISSGWGILTIPILLEGSGQNAPFMFQIFSAPFGNKNLILHLESAFFNLYAGEGNNRKKVGVFLPGEWQRIVCVLPTLGGKQSKAGIRLDSREKNGQWKIGEMVVIPVVPSPQGEYGDFRYIAHPESKDLKVYIDDLEFKFAPGSAFSF